MSRGFWDEGGEKRGERGGVGSDALQRAAGEYCSVNLSAKKPEFP